MKEIFYIFKSFKNLYFICGLDFYKQFSIGIELDIYKYCVNIQLSILFLEFIFEFGIIQTVES